jgi:hypothetical protein
MGIASYGVSETIKSPDMGPFKPDDQTAYIRYCLGNVAREVHRATVNCDNILKFAEKYGTVLGLSDFGDWRNTKIDIQKRCDAVIQVCSALPPALPVLRGRWGRHVNILMDSFQLKGVNADILRLFMFVRLGGPLGNIIEWVCRSDLRGDFGRDTFSGMAVLLGRSVSDIERCFTSDSQLFTTGLFSRDAVGDVRLTRVAIKLLNASFKAGQGVKSVVLGKKLEATLNKEHFANMAED